MGPDDGEPAVSAQERADNAACELAKAVAEMARPEDGEMVIIIRSSLGGVTVKDATASGDVLWTWDWFWRPKVDKPD